MNLTFPYTQNNNNVWLNNTGMPLCEHFQLENSMEQTPIQFSTSVGPKKKKSWFFLCKSVNRREIWLLSSFSDRRIKLDPAHFLFKDDRRIGGEGQGTTSWWWFWGVLVWKCESGDRHNNLCKEHTQSYQYEIKENSF